MAPPGVPFGLQRGGGEHFSIFDSKYVNYFRICNHFENFSNISAQIKDLALWPPGVPSGPLGGKGYIFKDLLKIY